LRSNYIPFCLCRGGEGEALKCLIWETVNRIYANLMIPAITGGNTSHFQAAEILLQFLLQSRSLWSLARSPLQAPETALLGSACGPHDATRTFAYGDNDALHWRPRASVFWGKIQRNLPWYLAVLASGPAITNPSLPASSAGGASQTQFSVPSSRLINFRIANPFVQLCAQGKPLLSSF